MTKNNLPKILVIIGPTATNKTSLSIKLANELNGELISADAFQVYKELNIGTNKPTLVEQSQAKFHLISLISMHENWDIKLFQSYASTLIDELLFDKKLPIIVGGSHLYIDALLKNYDLSATSRSSKYDHLSNEQLFSLLSIKDKALANKITQGNKKRLIRALELLEQGKELKRCNVEKYDALIIMCNRPRDVLYEKINTRVDEMFAAGWIKEVKTLYAQNSALENLNAMKAIGYHEIIENIKTKKPIDVDKIKQQTRNYAKRQLTWIRHHYKDVLIFNQDNYLEILSKVKAWIN